VVLQDVTEALDLVAKGINNTRTIVEAVNDALRASRELAEQKMQAVTGGLRIPGL